MKQEIIHEELSTKEFTEQESSDGYWSEWWMRKTLLDRLTEKLNRDGWRIMQVIKLECRFGYPYYDMVVELLIEKE